MKIDAEIADLQARPTPPRIVLDDGSAVDDSAMDDDFGADPVDRARDEIAAFSRSRDEIS